MQPRGLNSRPLQVPFNIIGEADGSPRLFFGDLDQDSQATPMKPALYQPRSILDAPDSGFYAYPSLQEKAAKSTVAPFVEVDRSKVWKDLPATYRVEPLCLIALYQLCGFEPYRDAWTQLPRNRDRLA